MFIVFGIILAIAVFLVIVLVHEAGHFFAARATKTKVEEFGIGIPPLAKKLGYDKKGTLYTLNWLPIWGFVRLKGEDISDEHSDDKDSFANRPYLARALVILAGVTMNFLFAGLVFSFLFWYGVSPIAFNSQFSTKLEAKLVPTVEQAIESRALLSSGLVLTPLTGGLAERSGMLAWDHLIAVDNVNIKTPKEFVDILTRGKAGQKYAVVLERKWQNETILLTPENGKIGAYIGYDVQGINPNFTIKYPFLEATKAGFQEAWIQSRLTLDLFTSLVSRLVVPKDAGERKAAMDSVGWPIAIASMFVQLTQNSAGFLVILAIAGIISINLAVFNLLPLPALDGGRFVSATIVSLLELFRFSRKRIRSWEAIIHSLGFILLLLLSVFIAFHDVLKFF